MDGVSEFLVEEMIHVAQFVSQFSSVTQSCLTLCNPWTVAHKAPLFTEFSRQEYWSGFPFPSPGDLPHPGTEPVSVASLMLAGRFFTTSATCLLKA